jgi:metallo-beta-lactamase family protein
MKVTFWGAAGEVTGSRHLVESAGKRVVLDCGLFQGHRKDAERKNRHIPFHAASVDSVILSHAHIDHSGNLPTLVKQGFRGPIYATPATIDLCESMLRDTAYIQQKDAEFVNKRRHRRPEAEREPVKPLYTMEDAERTLPLFRPVSYYTPTRIDDGLSYEFYDAGHMLGSSSVLLHCHENGKRVRLAFSGDIGRPNLPIIRDPDPPPQADYLIMESTYGGRSHKPNKQVLTKLTAVINRTAARGGRIIAPAFAVGRTQQLVLLLHHLANAGEIPNIPIFVDSPLAVNVTAAFRKHVECLDAETRQYLLDGIDPFGFERLRYVREASESRRLNDLHGPFLVIAASGMCEAGRVLHHLRNNIEDGRNTVLITGYQAENTLGRSLVEKCTEVRIFGEPMHVRAEVASLDEMSGHADQGELLAWLRPAAGNMKKIFLVHGEAEQSAALAQLITRQYGVEVIVPGRGQSFELN